MKNQAKLKALAVECSLCNGTGKMLTGMNEDGKPVVGTFGEVLTTGQTCQDSQGHNQASYAIISDRAGVRLALSLRKGALPFLPEFFHKMEETTRGILSQ